VTSFGVMMAVGAIVGLWLFARELKRTGLPDSAVDIGVAGVAGGLMGAKLLWVAEHVGEGPLTSLILSRGGMSWFGGFAGGLIAGMWLMNRRRLSPLTILAAATPGLAVGHAIGRIGCFLVGDDYGQPSALPWAVAFPQGLPPTDQPVHPTQLYEAIGLVAIAWALVRWRGRGTGDRFVLGSYLVMAGMLRFAIEFVRVNQRILGPFTVAHLASLVVAGTGAVVLVHGCARTSAS